MSKEALSFTHTLCQARTKIYISAPLSFLYQTRTLLGPVCRNGFRQPSTSSHDFSTSTASQAFEDIPFQNHTPDTFSAKSSDLPKSTITDTERATFDRIFNKLVKTETSTASSPNDDTFFDSSDTYPSQNDSLESIFDEAIKVVKKHSRKTPISSSPIDQSAPSSLPKPIKIPQGGLFRRHTSQSSISFRSVFPPSLQESFDAVREQALATTRPRHPINVPYSGMRRINVEPSEKIAEPADEYERQVRDARSEDINRVTKLLEAAKSDIEIWRVLEKEVFARMTELNARLKKEGKAKRAVTLKVKGRRPKNTPVLSPVAELSTTPVPPDAELASPSAKPQDQPPESQLLDISTTPFPLHPLSLLQVNYATHLLHALRLLRSQHPASPCGPALLPAIKRLGSISYVLGASTALYNELLCLRWVHYRDAHACADLVFEMLEHGVQTDWLTKAVWKDAEAKRRRAKGVELAWWGLQGVRSGWERWGEGMREAWRVEKEGRERAGWVGVDENGEGVEASAGKVDGFGEVEDGEPSSEAEVDVARTGDGVPSSGHGDAASVSM